MELAVRKTTYKVTGGPTPLILPISSHFLVKPQKRREGRLHQNCALQIIFWPVASF
jgi:hypothetical protein